jgi:leucyl aminopeptidase (aminopeptidase T)
LLGKSVEEIVNHQLTASRVDSPMVRAKGKKLARLMRTRGEVVVRAEDEVLRFRLGGEQEIDDGIVDRADLAAGNNMTSVPPGYFAQEIVLGTLSGAIRIHAPLPRLGAMSDIRLEFAGGKLKSWESAKNQDWLNGLVRGTPEQRRTLSAIVVGLNPSMTYGHAQDRLVEGAITFFGMFQGTTRNGSLEADGRLLVDRGRILT